MFWASQLLFGVAAGLLVMALAGVFAMPELIQQYSQIALSASPGRVRLVGFGVIALTVLAAGIAGWLGFAVARRRRRAQLFGWVFCGLAVCCALAVLILRPGDGAPWLPGVLQIASAGVAMLAVAAAVLLSQPGARNAFGSRLQTTPGEPAQPPAGPVPVPVTSDAVRAPQPTAAPTDFDPFS